MLRIRGHHLLCTALFEGNGYDSAFSIEMEKVVRCLRERPQTEVFLCCGETDDLCRHCPNRNADSGCLLGTKDAESRDRNLLEAICTVSGKFRYGELREKLRNLSEADFEQVCSACRWKEAGICSFQKFYRSWVFQK